MQHWHRTVYTLMALIVAAFASSAHAQSAGTITLDSITPERQRVYDFIELRGQGFGTYVPGASAIRFTGNGVTIAGGVPYVWRDDYIRIRVPVGDRINGVNQPIPKTSLDVSVVTPLGSSNSAPFQVRYIANASLLFFQRTAIASDQDVTTFLGSPNLNHARTKDADVADVNADGLPDIIDNNSNNESNDTHPVLRLNLGGISGFSATPMEPLGPSDPGVFATTVPPGGDYLDNSTTYDADFVDLNNDGYPDLVQTASLDGSNRLRILMNNHLQTPGAFLEDSQQWINRVPFNGCTDDVAHADINYDGFVDIAVSLRTRFCPPSTSTVQVLLNDAGTTFGVPITLTAPSQVSTHDVFFIDANHDGYLDVCMVNEDGTICEIFYHDQGTTPAFSIGATIPTKAYAGDPADFNGDGLDDFSLGENGAAAVFINDPINPGNFTQSLLPDGVQFMYDMQPGDIDLDGDVDIVGAAVVGNANDAIRIWINQGDGTFINATSPGATTVLPGLGAYQRLSADLIDFDSDGDLDLYVTGGDGQDVGPCCGFGRIPNQFYQNLIRCLADVVVDGDINVTDLLQILAAWGDCQGICLEDLDDDDQVGITDLLILLSSWGPCP